MNQTQIHIIALTSVLWLTGCGKSENADTTATAQNNAAPVEEAAHGHEHEEVPLGTFDIEGIMVEAAQGHGSIEAGKESHLVVKLPYDDNGATVVRAWIGTQDRTLSSVGRGDYSTSHGDYDIHAIAPDPLPEDAQWWIEIEKPDDSKAVGAFPLLKDITR